MFHAFTNSFKCFNQHYGPNWFNFINLSPSLVVIFFGIEIHHQSFRLEVIFSEVSTEMSSTWLCKAHEIKLKKNTHHFCACPCHSPPHRRLTLAFTAGGKSYVNHFWTCNAQARSNVLKDQHPPSYQNDQSFIYNVPSHRCINASLKPNSGCFCFMLLIVFVHFITQW